MRALCQRRSELHTFWSEPLELDMSGGLGLTCDAVGSQVAMSVRRHRRYSTEFKLPLAEAYLAGKGTAKGHGTILLAAPSGCVRSC